MTEYIIKVDEDTERWRNVQQQCTHFLGHSLVDEIVRCKDCKHYRFEDRSHIFNDNHHNDSFCLRFVDGRRMEVGPDGFCAWGERREP